jgi:Zn-dependent M16 (insulinase) family peptidase
MISSGTIIKINEKEVRQMKRIYEKMMVTFVAVLMLFSSFNNRAYLNPVYGAQKSTVGQGQQDLHGFELVSQKKFSNLGSCVYIYKHMKTGARLMYVKNDDTQRVFSISFRTPAVDDKGVNHIIEHSVLDGSKNYPVKSPFKEMLKGSLGTFINALTYPDHTSYPVSSTNEQDLKNLMGVYLDAVFQPNVLTDDNIFKQEGWRYELPSADAPITINGVVYNEMKGNYSNPQNILRNTINQSLFQDTTYKWESGGDPDVIPTLTKEQLVETYKQNYNPSNSYIYLYGKMNIESYLDYIDTNYLSKYDKKDTEKTSVKMQQPLSAIQDKTVVYPVDKAGDTNNKTYLSLNFVTGTIKEEEKNIALGILDYLLTGTDDAPVKKAITDLKIAKNVSSSFNRSGIQPTYSIYALNSNEASKEIFEKTIMNTLKDIAKNGFDKDFLKAAIASYNISKRSENLIMPVLGGKGLNLSTTALSTWIYDEDPTLYFDSSDVEKKILNSESNRYFQKLITECFLNNNQHSLVVVKPEAGLEEQNVAKQKAALEDYKKKIGAEGCSKLMESTKAYKDWQNTADSKEALATLPRLSLKDIKPELPDLSYKVVKKDGVNILTHNANLDGFSSINLYFDTSAVPQKKLHYLALIASLLGNINTKRHSSKALSNEMSQSMLSPVVFSPSAVANYKNADQYSPKMSASFIVPDEKIAKSFDIVNDILKNTKFSDKKKIKDYMEQTISGLQMLYGSGSGQLASMQLNSYMSESGKYSNALVGESYYKFLVGLNKKFNSKWKEISKNLKKVYQLAINKNGLVVSYSGSKNSEKPFQEGLNTITKNLNSKKIAKQNYTFGKGVKNIGYATSGKVQTIVQAGNFKKAGIKYSGKMLVLQNILDMGYLWNKVRTDGGAYGVSSGFSYDGTMTLSSMRDPNLQETLDAFAGTVDYLKNFTATDEEMADYIIGAVKGYVNLKSSGAIMEGALCDSMYLTGLTENDLIKEEKEALTTKAADIRAYAAMMDKIIKQNIYFVEGSKDKIKKHKGLFNKVETVKY